MSLILDALNKADGERSPEDTPSLNSNHDIKPKESPPGINLNIVYALVGVLIFLVLIVIVLMVRGTSSPATNNLQPAPSANKAANTPALPAHQAQTPSSQNSTPNKPQGRYVEIKEKLIAKQYESSAQKPLSNSDTSTAKSTVANPPTVSSKKIASIYQKSKEEAQKPKITATPKPTPAPKLPNLEDYPLLSYIGDLAYAKQKGIPTLMYTEHNYSKNAASVVLNNVTRRAGQSIADHLTLEAIVEDGIVLKYKSLRFKVMAFNSWINM